MGSASCADATLHSSRAFAAIKQPLVTSANAKEGIAIMCSLQVRHCLVATLCVLSPLFCAAQEPAVSNEVSYVSFQVPGALGTYPASINSANTVTGDYVAPTGDQPAFVRRFDGAITTFTVPGSGQTTPSAINDAGEIAGSYVISPDGGPQLCFLRARDGSITTFTPAASSGTAVVTGINERGTVVGYYTDDTSTSSTYGFIRHRDGVVETIAVEGSAKTRIAGINAAGDVTGWYLNGSYISGYVRSAQGRVTTFDLGTALLPTSINDAGTITGYYLVPVSLDDNWNHEFIRSPDGDMTTFTPPGTIWPGFLGINDEGTIAGNYQLPPSASNPAVYFAFDRRRYGEITTIAPESGWQTMTTGINRAGVITGYYYNAAGPGAFAFLRIPARCSRRLSTPD
jgi:hypothetical protein